MKLTLKIWKLTMNESTTFRKRKSKGWDPLTMELTILMPLTNKIKRLKNQKKIYISKTNMHEG